MWESLNRDVPRKTGKVVVLFAKSGSLGHESVAHAHLALLKKQGYDATAIDVNEYEGARDFRWTISIYFWLLRTAPWLWRFFYSYWAGAPGERFVRRRLIPHRFRRTREYLAELSPSIIITTHPLATSIASYVKARRGLRFHLLVAFSDWHIQPHWLHDNVDLYLVATELQRQELIRRGIRDHSVARIGILVDECYYMQQDRQRARDKLGISANERVLLVMSGGTGWRLEQFISVVCRLTRSVEVFVVGIPDARRKKLQKLLRKESCVPARIHLLGRTDVRPYFAAADVFLSKPGGSSVAEALAVGVPTVLAFPIPGLEESNLKALLATMPVAELPAIRQASYLEHILGMASIWRPREREEARRVAKDGAQWLLATLIHLLEMPPEAHASPLDAPTRFTSESITV